MLELVKAEGKNAADTSTEKSNPAQFTLMEINFIMEGDLV